MPLDVLVRHQCMIYDGAASRTLPALVGAVRHALQAGKRCMYFNSASMVAGFKSQLYAAGTDVQYEISRGALVLADDDSHLDHGRFSTAKMISTLEAAVEQALEDGYVGLFATGDMTWEFGPEKDFSKLLEYEWQLEELFRRQPALSGVCQYHRDLLPREVVREGAASHEGLFLSDTLSCLNPVYVPARSPAERRAAMSPDLDTAIDGVLALKR